MFEIRHLRREGRGLPGSRILGKKRRKGAILVFVMLLILMFFVMGMTLLSIRTTQAKSSFLMRNGKIGKYLAIAGMEDARVKLLKDIDFPPVDLVEDHTFTYAEEVKFPGDPSPVGYFVVTVDTTRNDSKNSNFDGTLRVSSVGVAIDSEGSALASYRIGAVMDAQVENRSGTGLNQYRYQYIDWQDHGAL